MYITPVKNPAMIKDQIILYKEAKKPTPQQALYKFTSNGYEKIITQNDLHREIAKAKNFGLEIGVTLININQVDKKLIIKGFLPLHQCFWLNDEIVCIQAEIKSPTNTLVSVYTIEEILNAYE